MQAGQKHNHLIMCENGFVFDFPISKYVIFAQLTQHTNKVLTHNLHTITQTPLPTQKYKQKFLGQTPPKNLKLNGWQLFTIHPPPTE